MRITALFLICLVTVVMITGCAVPTEPGTDEGTETPAESGTPDASGQGDSPNEMESAITDAVITEQELDTSDLDQIENDLDDLDW